MKLLTGLGNRGHWNGPVLDISVIGYRCPSFWGEMEWKKETSSDVPVSQKYMTWSKTCQAVSLAWTLRLLSTVIYYVLAMRVSIGIMVIQPTQQAGSRMSSALSWHRLDNIFAFMYAFQTKGQTYYTPINQTFLGNVHWYSYMLGGQVNFSRSWPTLDFPRRSPIFFAPLFFF